MLPYKMPPPPKYATAAFAQQQGGRYMRVWARAFCLCNTIDPSLPRPPYCSVPTCSCCVLVGWFDLILTKWSNHFILCFYVTKDCHTTKHIIVSYTYWTAHVTAFSEEELNHTPHTWMTFTYTHTTTCCSKPNLFVCLVHSIAKQNSTFTWWRLKTCKGFSTTMSKRPSNAELLFEVVAFF